MTVQVPSDLEVHYGGPYLNESEAIEAELLHAHIEGRPVTATELFNIFKGKGISAGAVKLIETHIDGHPLAGYAGERQGENVVLPEGYVVPGDGGINTVDDEGQEPAQSAPEAPAEPQQETQQEATGEPAAS